MPPAVMYTAIDVYHAPQTKNWRNIMTLRRILALTASPSR
jgi:hypothetical protein